MVKRNETYSPDFAYTWYKFNSFAVILYGINKIFSFCLQHDKTIPRDDRKSADPGRRAQYFLSCVASKIRQFWINPKSKTWNPESKI